MMDLTDRHARFLLRLISRHALLYTEMVTAEAVLHGDRSRLLAYNAEEHPLALQLGGSDPKKLAQCSQIASDLGFDEVNLNVGCPSDRVQSGKFGACLMLEPKLVADCYEAMASAAQVPITIKCRLGVDQQDPHETLAPFIDLVASAGCQSFSIHARKAWLKGLSPKENRTRPPLDYELVYKVKQQFPALTIVINGGIESLQEASEHLQHVDGVMLGRKAYYEPYTLHNVDELIFETGADDLPRLDARSERLKILEQYIDYVEAELANGTALKHMSKHVLGLFHGEPGARAFRRHISENAYTVDADASVLREAIELLELSAARAELLTESDAEPSATTEHKP